MRTCWRLEIRIRKIIIRLTIQSYQKTIKYISIVSNYPEFLHCSKQASLWRKALFVYQTQVFRGELPSVQSWVVPSNRGNWVTSIIKEKREYTFHFCRLTLNRVQLDWSHCAFLLHLFLTAVCHFAPASRSWDFRFGFVGLLQLPLLLLSSPPYS